MYRKVLIISHLFPSSQQPNNGIFIKDQLGQLSKDKRLKFLVISPVPFVPWPLNLLSEKWADYKRVELIEHHKNFKVFHPRYFCLPRNIFFSLNGVFIYLSLRYGKNYKELYKFNPDIIHNHCILPDALAGILLSKRFRAKTLVTVHGSDINLYPNRSKLANLLTKFVLKKSDQIIAVSQNVQKKVNKLFPNHKTRVIFVGYNQELFSKRQNKYCQDLVYVGRLIKSKGIYDLVDIFSMLKSKYPNIKLNIIGEGPEKVALKKYISKKHLKDICLVGGVVHSKLSNKMSSSGIFIFPSYSEGLPVSLVEAMALGKVIVTRSFEGVGKLITNKENGIIFSTNKQAVERISEVLEDKQLFKKLSANASISVKDLSVQKISRDIIEVYNSMRINICVVTTAHPSYDIRVFHKQVKTLATEGYQIIYIGPGGESSEFENITFVEIKRSKLKLLNLLRNFRIYLFVQKQRSKICHFHDLDFIPWGLLLKRQGMRVIYDVHELYHEVIGVRNDKSKLARFFIKKLIIFFEKKASDKFDLIVCAWPEIAEKFDKKKVVLVQNFPIKNYYKNFQLKKSNKRFVYAGNLSQARGTLELVKAAKIVKCKDFQLFLIGRFFESKFQNKIENEMNHNNTFFIPWMRQEKLVPFLENSYCGIVTLHPLNHHRNNIVNKMFEYMAAGLPQIASNFPMWKKIVEGNQCGVCVNPLNSDEIAKAIDFLCKNKRLALQMGKNARNVIEKKYSWENESKELKLAYKKLLEHVF